MKATGSVWSYSIFSGAQQVINLWRISRKPSLHYQRVYRRERQSHFAFKSSLYTKCLHWSCESRSPVTRQPSSFVPLFITTEALLSITSVYHSKLYCISV